MPRAKVVTNGRKRSAPTNNNTIKQTLGDGDHAVSSKVMRKLFPLPIPTIPSVNGNVLVCGQGDVGQLGLGSDASKFERKRPALVASIKNAVDVSAGGMHTLVLTKDGSIYSFGCNDEGALGRDTSVEGSEYEPGLIELPAKAVMISAGDSHSACLLENGSVMAWGSFRDSHGNMGLTMDGNKRVPCDLLEETCCKISSGSDHLVILTCRGHLYTIGCAEQGQLGRVSQHSASGEGRRGKTNLLRPARVVLRKSKLLDDIWATNYCTFARESVTGRIFAFGLNNYKQIGHEKNIEVITFPTEVKLPNAKMITGGQHHTMVLQNDGSVHVIGRHDYGRLGIGKVSSDITVLTPVKALKDKVIKHISCGESTSFAITEKGELYSWGFGSNNQLGTGSEDDEIEPMLVKSKETADKHILLAASGGQHSVFLVRDDNVEEKSQTTSNKKKAENKK